MKLLPLSLLIGALTSVASAQISVVAADSFDYPISGSFHGLGTGVGWSNTWFVTGAANDEMAVFDNTTTPMLPLADAVGGHIGHINTWGSAFRQFDLAAHSDLVEPVSGRFGADDTTMWFSYTAQRFQGMPQEHFGGLSFYHAGAGEIFFLGSTWDSIEWGIGGNGGPNVTVAGSDDAVAARLVYRIDFAAGQERVRLYLNPTSDYPTGVADVDEFTNDFNFDEIRLSGGGNNNDMFFFDNLVVAKGEPSANPGTNYCSANANSTGVAAEMSAAGSTTVAANNLTITAGMMPTNAFGFFITSQTQGFVANPGGSSGNLCIGGSIGRYVGPGQIQNSGSAGSISIMLDLANMPQPTGSVSVLQGDTWNFQAWFRDVGMSGPTSNFTDGLQIDFL